MKTERRGRKALRLKAALQAAHADSGETVLDVWYEPINGPCIEMQGHAGGWYFRMSDGTEDVLGYNFEEAMEMILLAAKALAREQERACES